LIFKRPESPFVFIELFTYSPKLGGSIIFFVYTPAGPAIVWLMVIATPKQREPRSLEQTGTRAGETRKRHSDPAGSSPARRHPGNAQPVQRGRACWPPVGVVSGTNSQDGTATCTARKARKPGKGGAFKSNPAASGS
jgi:hypothetical protein